MSEFIINCIQSGAYSAVFALLLVYAVRSAAVRERRYREFIAALCESLEGISAVGVKLDELIELTKKAAAAKKPKQSEAARRGEIGAAVCETACGSGV